MKRILACILAVMMIFTMSFSTLAADFKDVDENVDYYEAIDTLATLGIVEGYKGEFTSEGTMTRAAVATIMVRTLYGEPKNVAISYFDDVPVDHWANKYITAAYNYGLIAGYGNGKFGPNDPITYDAMAKIILNALNRATPGAWPESVRKVAAAAGLYENMAAVDGSAVCTRGAACQMIYNAFDCLIWGNTYTTTLLSAMGYEVTVPTMETEGTNIGHWYMTYTDIYGEEYVTNVPVTFGIEAIAIDSDSYKIGKKSYNIDWDTTYLFVNGVRSYDATILTEDDEIELICTYDEDDNLIVLAIRIWEYTTYSVYEIAPDAVVKDVNYIKGFSTVTYYDDDNYTICNDYYCGQAADVYTTSAGTYVKFTDGETYFWDIDLGAIDIIIGDYVILFFDCFGNIDNYITR